MGKTRDTGYLQNIIKYDDDNKIGIGTELPSVELDVVGSGKFSNKLTIGSIDNATTDTDKFLVSDGGTVKYRTGSEVKSDIGLGSVDDTSDANKPISTATQAALDLITDVNWTGDYNNGVTYTVGDGVMFNGASFRMIVAIGAAGYNPAAYPANWLQVTDYVSANDIGLGNVDNTSDLNKPISSATQNALDNKVDKVTGKGLSTNDYTTTEKDKLAGIEDGAEVNVNADWNATSGDAQILNKPIIPDQVVPAGGTTGQILAKVDDTNYNLEWIENYANYTSVLKHIVRAGAAINKGQAVYVSGANGTNIIVSKASNTTEATSSKTMGLLAQTLAINENGFVVTEGLLSGLNTIGAVAGDPVWLGTNGNLIYGLANKPYAPAHLVFIGVVTRVNANNGEIFINVQNGFELNEIHDVDLKTTVPINGDVLGFNGTLWVNKTIAGWLGYTPVTNERTLSINGTALDLTANRSWSVGTVTSLGLDLGNAGTDLSIANSPITSSGNITLNIPTASVANRGALSSTDWSTFNNKQNAITLTTTGSSGSSSLVGATLNIPTYTLSGLGGQPLATNLTSLSGLNYASTSFVKMTASGTFSLDTNIYYLASNPSGFTSNTGTVTSVAALTLGTSGTDLSSTVFTGTTTPVITLNVPTASATNRGALSSADWTTFNSKANASGTTNYVSKFTGSTSLGNSQIFDNGTNVGIGTTSPATKFVVSNNGAEGMEFGYSGGISANYIQSINRSTFAPTDFALYLGELGASIKFYTETVERMRITSAGNVGIGTTSPSAKLQINASSWAINGSNVSRMLQKSVGVAGDYEQHVILLHPIYNGSLIDYNKCSGTIFASRGGTSSGLINDTYYLDTASAYNSYNGTINSVIGNGKLYTCDYNGVKYMALLPDYRTSAVEYDFDGYIKSTGEELKLVVYRLSNSGTIINSEVNNSLAIFGSGTTYYQGNVQTAGSFIGNLSGTADQTSVTFSNSGTTFESFFNSQPWLTDKNYLIYNTSDAPRGGLGLYTVAMNNWDAAYGSMFAIDCEPGQGIAYIKPKYGGTFGVWKMLIDNASTQTIGGNKNFTNNLGIGTTSPIAKLDVINNSTYQLRLASTSSNYSSGGLYLGALGTSDPFYYGFARWNQDNICFEIGSQHGNSNGGITFLTGTGTASQSEKMRILANGNLAIGLSETFGFKTLINSGSSSNNLILFSTTSGVNLTFNDLNTGVGSQIGGVANDLFVKTNNAERMRITSGGNVGIGTTSPQGKLTVSGGSVGLEIGSNNTQSDLLSFDRSAGVYKNLLFRGNDFIFSPLDSEKMRITSAGNVGIGTTSPSSKLDVSGNVKAQGFYTPGFVIPAAAVGVLNNNNYGGPGWDNASFVTGNGATGVMMGGDPASYTYGWISGVQTDNGSIKKLVLQPLGGNVGINTTTPDNSAALDVSSTTQGFLPPRMTTSERDAIGSPVNGLMIWNTDNRQLEVYAVGTWLGLATV
jgi:hypothetical protein